MSKYNVTQRYMVQNLSLFVVGVITANVDCNLYWVNLVSILCTFICSFLTSYFKEIPIKIQSIIARIGMSGLLIYTTSITIGVTDYLMKLK